MSTTILTQIAALIVAVFTLLGVLSAIEAVMKRRSAEGAVAWVVSLLTFPYLAVPIYWIFGRTKFDGYLEQRKAVERAVLHDKTATSDALWPNSVNPEDLPHSLRALLGLSRTTVSKGNALCLLIDGIETHQALLQAIREATRHIYMVYYIIRDDEIGREVIEALAEKTREGVSTYFIYDEIGSRPFSKSQLLEWALAQGINIVPFNTTRGRRNRFQLNFRNHRKLVCIDSRLTLLGGHNIGREYLGRNAKIGAWRDTHIKIEGPATLAAELTFATDWRWATGQQLDLRLEAQPAGEQDAKVLVFPSDPASDYEEAGLMYHQLISDATERLWITSPYFIPDNSIISALTLAVLRGVDVRVMIPDNPDGPIVAMANWSYTRELLPLGVKVYRYRYGFMHQKVILVDGLLCGIGTANFDNRSFKLAFEVTALIDDADFCEQVANMLETDFARAELVSDEAFTQKPWWFRPAMALARLFSPIL